METAHKGQQEHEQPQYIADIPEEVRQDTHALTQMALSAKEKLRDPQWLPRHQRLIVARAACQTIEGKCSSYEYLTSPPVDTENSGPVIVISATKKSIKNKNSQDGTPSVDLQTIKDRHHGRTFRYALVPTAKDSNEEQLPQADNIAQLSKEISRIHRALISLIKQDNLIPKDEHTFFLDQSLRLEQADKEKLLRELERLEEQNTSDRYAFSEETIKLLRILINRTLEDKCIDREGIATKLNIPKDPNSLNSVATKITKLSSSLERSGKTTLTVGTEPVPNDGRFSGYYLTTRAKDPEEIVKSTSDPITINPEEDGVQPYTPENRKILISIIEHAKEYKIRAKINIMAPTIFECLATACKTGRSITPEYCKYKHGSKKYMPTRRFETSADSLRQRALADFGFVILKGSGGRYQAFLPSDPTKYQAVLAEIAENKKAEDERAEVPNEELKARIEDSIRHFSGITDKKKFKTVLLLMLNLSRKKGSFTTGELLAKTKPEGSILVETIHQWMNLIKKTNEKTEEDNYPSIIGFTIINLSVGRFKLVATPTYKKSPISSKQRNPVWPVPLREDRLPFDREVFERIMREIPIESEQIRRVAEFYAMNSEKGFAIPGKLATSTLGGPCEETESDHTRITGLSQSRISLEKHGYGLTFPVSHKAHYASCDRQSYLENWTERQNRAIDSLKTTFQELEERMQKVPKNFARDWAKAAKRIINNIETARSIIREITDRIPQLIAQPDWQVEIDNTEKQIESLHRILGSSITTFRKNVIKTYIATGQTSPLQTSEATEINPIEAEGIAFDRESFDKFIETNPKLSQKTLAVLKIYADYAEKGQAISSLFICFKLKGKGIDISLEEIAETRRSLEKRNLPFTFRKHRRNTMCIVSKDEIVRKKFATWAETTSKDIDKFSIRTNGNSPDATQLIQIKEAHTRASEITMEINELIKKQAEATTEDLLASMQSINQRIQHLRDVATIIKEALSDYQRFSLGQYKGLEENDVSPLNHQPELDTKLLEELISLKTPSNNLEIFATINLIKAFAKYTNEGFATSFDFAYSSIRDLIRARQTELQEDCRDLNDDEIDPTIDHHYLEEISPTESIHRIYPTLKLIRLPNNTFFLHMDTVKTLNEILRLKIENMERKLLEDEEDLTTMDNLIAGVYSTLHTYTPPTKTTEYQGLLGRTFIPLCPSTKSYKALASLYEPTDEEILVQLITENGRQQIIKAPKAHIMPLDQTAEYNQQGEEEEEPDEWDQLAAQLGIQ